MPDCSEKKLANIGVLERPKACLYIWNIFISLEKIEY